MDSNTNSLITDWLRIVIDQNGDFSFHISSSVLIIILLACIAVLIARLFGLFGNFSIRTFEIHEAEFGLGDQKIKLRPNNTDIQIAYQIWVELSTRKIGLKIDLENDVITEIYNSWYEFFSITRELAKKLPASKFRRKDTQRIVQLSIDLLNEGIRPHLTKWQARFRRWYEYELQKSENTELTPQDIQRKFKHYDELTSEMIDVNNRLINYRNKMHEIISSS